MTKKIEEFDQDGEPRNVGEVIPANRLGRVPTDDELNAAAQSLIPHLNKLAKQWDGEYAQTLRRPSNRTWWPDGTL